MPQAIFNSRCKGTPFKTFLVDYNLEDGIHFTWHALFNTIHEKYGINLKVLRLFDYNNKAVDYKDISDKEKFNVSNFHMLSTTGKSIGDFWINFDIYPRKGETLY